MADSDQKFIPFEEREYLVTDECLWERMEKQEQEKYNPLDGHRSPHVVSLVDQITGTVVHLKSGSIVKIIKATK